MLPFDINPPASRYPGEASTEIYQRLEAAIYASPGVIRVIAQNPPLLAEQHVEQ